MRRKLGFSLVELLIVLALVAAVTMLAINVYGNHSQKASLVAVEADLTKLANQLELYRQRHGTYEVNKDKFETAQLELLTTHSPSFLPFVKREFNLVISSASASDYVLKALPLDSSNVSVTLFSNGSLLWGKSGK